MDHFSLAKAAYEAALKEYTMSVIELRNGARVIETGVTGGYDQKTRSVPLLSRTT